MRYFTLAQAEALIPRFEAVFAAAAEIRAKAQEKAAELARLEAARAPDESALAIGRSQLEFLSRAFDEALRGVQEAGAVVKGIEPALVDFPHRLDGREVYLCWRLGEKAITHYHGIEGGFSGRKPLPPAGKPEAGKPLPSGAKRRPADKPAPPEAGRQS